MTPSRAKAAFTLVELLVVSGLFLLFFSLVINAARPNPRSQVRQLSQDLASAILATQTRAMRSESGAGLMIDASGAAVFTAQTLPLIVGNVTGWTPTATSLNGSFSPTNADTGDLAACFAVEFFRQTDGATISPWMAFQPPSTASLDAAMNQTMNNTVLVLPAASSDLGFMAARRPVAGDRAVTMPRFAALDLRYSGVGMVTADPFGRLSACGTVSMVFDRSGCLDTLIQTAGSPASIKAPGPLYLLLATTDDIAANTSLTSPISRWIVIAPDTGRITVAANVGVAFTGTPTDSQINNARFNARQAITQGAR